MHMRVDQPGMTAPMQIDHGRQRLPSLAISFDLPTEMILPSYRERLRHAGRIEVTILQLSRIASALCAGTGAAQVMRRPTSARAQMKIYRILPTRPRVATVRTTTPARYLVKSERQVV
jgi:hypothetical protein